jgi:hypothetical protein
MKDTKLRVAAASVRGQSHRTENTPCQDAVFEERSSYLSGVCVADGAGSCVASHIGARITTEWTARYVRREFAAMFEEPDAGSSKLLIDLKHHLTSEAALCGCKPSDLSCTLMFAFAETRRREVRYLCGNLGDGVILMQQNGITKILMNADNGEFANQTWFVTSSDANTHFRVCTGSCPVESLPGWLLATDGAWPFLYRRSSGTVARAAQSLLEDVRTATPRRSQIALSSFLENMIIPRSSDDCSIALLQTIAHGRHISRRPIV